MSDARRIGVIHLNQIGDLIFALPLLASLREKYPRAEIVSILKPGLVELLEDSPYVDRCLPKKEGLRAQLGLMRDLRRQAPDLLICLARSEEALMLTTLGKAKLKAGFANFPWDVGLDVKEQIEGHNSWYNNAKLLKALGIPIAQDNYVGLLHVREVQPPAGLPKRYAVISAGASSRRLIKAWDEDKFADLIMRLQKHYDLSAVLVGGADSRACDERIMELGRARFGSDQGGVIDLSGRLSLKDLVAVLKQAALFVGIDSGVMHLASALDLPVVGLFGPTDPFYVGPQNRRSRVVREELACMPCYVKPSCREYDCLRILGVDRVWDACVGLLGSTAG
ncbi:MAG: glycosyltransferase family 9 protein [Syntrophaceae bacterium]